MQKITYFEREIIEVGLRCNKSVRAIARSLSRDHRVIQREVDRNKGEHSPYIAAVAQRISDERQRNKNKPELEKLENKDLRDYVVGKIKEDWSPEQIAGVLNTGLAEETNKTISHESIYKYIYEGEGRWESLWPHLRKGKKKRRKQKSRKAKKASIPSRISIHARPKEIDNKITYGHWESDTLECGKMQKEKISVQYERKSQLTRIHKTKDKTSLETEEAIRKSIDSLPTHLWKSITFDNGSEGATHANLREDYNINTYRCDAYSSWQKGGVENVNGLLRQYLPKNTDLSKLTKDHLRNIQERLNNRPRKSLNYLTPNQVIARETSSGGAV